MTDMLLMNLLEEFERYFDFQQGTVHVKGILDASNEKTLIAFVKAQR